MEVSPASGMSADIARILKMISSSNSDMAEKLIKMQATMAVQSEKAETTEQIIDLYA